MASKDIKVDDLPSPEELQKEDISADTLPSPDELEGVSRLPAEKQMLIASQPTRAQSLARGAGQGVTLGLQAPLAGLGAAGVQAITGNQGPVQGRNLPALLAAYQQMKSEQMAKNQAAQKANPGTYMAGQLLGAAPTLIGTGGANPSAATMTAQGAVAGAGNYVGNTQNPSVAGTAGNAALGAALPTVLPAALKASGIPQVAGMVGQGLKNAAGGLSDMAGNAAKTASSLLPDVMKQNWQAGTEGISTSKLGDIPGYLSDKLGGGDITLSKEAMQKVLPEESNKAADAFTKRILSANTELRTDVDKTLKEATDGGMTFGIDKPLAGEEGEEAGPSPYSKAIDSLDQLSQQERAYNDPSTDEGRMAAKLLGKITRYDEPEEGETASSLTDQFGNPLTKSTEDRQPRINLSPLEVRNLSKDVLDYAGVLKANGQTRLSGIARTFSADLRQLLKQEVPDYADAAERLFQFQRYLPETLMARGDDPALAGVNFSDRPASQYVDLKDPTQDMISNLAKNGTGSDQAKQTFNKLDDALEQLSTLEQSRQAEAQVKGIPFESVFDKMGMNKSEIMKYLQNKALRTATYDTMKTGSLPVHTPSSVTQALADMTRKTGGAISNAGGLAFNAPKEVLYAVGKKLSSHPEVAELGTGLINAVQSGDIVKQNAAIFSIMQNPAAKSIIDPNAKDESNKEGKNPKKQPYGTYSF